MEDADENEARKWAKMSKKNSGGKKKGAAARRRKKSDDSDDDEDDFVASDGLHTPPADCIPPPSLSHSSLYPDDWEPSKPKKKTTTAKPVVKAPAPKAQSQVRQRSPTKVQEPRSPTTSSPAPKVME